MHRNAESAALSPDLAMKIYAYKLDWIKIFGPYNVNARLIKFNCTRVAKKFNVSAKAVKDIWNKRTWAIATCSRWDAETMDRWTI